jgi:hypothetical protein
VKNIIHGNNQLTAQKVAEEFEISIGSCHRILKQNLFAKAFDETEMILRW